MSYQNFDERRKKAFEALEKLQQDYHMVYQFLAITPDELNDLEIRLRQEGTEDGALNDRCSHIVEASRLVSTIREHLLETHLDYLLEQNPSGLV